MNVPSITSIYELYKDVNVSESDKGMKAVRIFIVETNAQTDPSQILRAYAQGIPKRGSLFAEDSFLYLKTKQIAIYGDEFSWKVTCNYEPMDGDIKKKQENDDSDPDPLDDPPEIDIDSQGYSQAVRWAYLSNDTRDNPTQPLVNSATDPFDPGLMEEVFLAIITITRNESDFNFSRIKEYQNTLNKDSVTIAGIPIGPYEAKMKKIKPAKAYKADGTKYYKITYSIEINSDSHLHYPLDAGFYKIDNTDHVPIKDGEGNPVAEPRMLDGHGAESSSPVYLEFQTVWALPWRPLALPEEF